MLPVSIELDSDELNPEWQLIRMCYRLRNSILHHQNFVELNSAEYKFLFQHDSLKVIGATQLMKPSKSIAEFAILDRKLNDELIDASSNFFRKIFDFIYNRNKRV